MITVRLKGGLGNQMFQYALGRVLSLKNNTGLNLDISLLELNLKNTTQRTYSLDVFNIKAEVVKRSKIQLLFGLLKRKIIKSEGEEKSFQFDPKILSMGDGICLDGYWQSQKYFSGFEEIIKKDFTLKNPINPEVQVLAEEMARVNSLCIHVRRGDYVNNPNHDTIKENYYLEAINYIKNKGALDKIYVFSDDIKWCKDNMSFEFPATFVGNEYVGIHGEVHMYLMSRCRNFIIANSSFSWWGAWLSENKSKIVICPKQWFGDATIDTSDLIPKEWIPLEIG